MGKPRVIQNHHFSYDPEIKGKLWKGEHEILTKINMYTRKSVSTYFIQCLEAWAVLNKSRALDLDSLSKSEMEE